MSEIFQWKGQLPQGLDASFSQGDKIHVGEEIADVFIYSTRLCDICNIDMSGAVKYCLEHDTVLQKKDLRCLKDNTWTELSYTDLENDLKRTKFGILNI